MSNIKSASLKLKMSFIDLVSLVNANKANIIARLFMVNIRIAAASFSDNHFIDLFEDKTATVDVYVQKDQSGGLLVVSISGTGEDGGVTEIIIEEQLSAFKDNLKEFKEFFSLFNEKNCMLYNRAILTKE